MRHFVKKTLTLFLVCFYVLSASASAKIHETRWEPDTCNGCVVVYQWDDSVPESQRVHTIKSIVKPDEAYKNLSPDEQFKKIAEDNIRKNVAVNEIVKERPDIKPDTVKFSYDAEKNLVIDEPRLNNAEKFNVEATVDDEKVIIQ